MYRQADLNLPERLTSGRAPTQLEQLALDNDRRDTRGSAGRMFYELDGDIVVLASGGGTSVEALDDLCLLGGRPAIFTEYSGNPTPEKVNGLTKIALQYPRPIHAIWVIGGRANFTDIYETLINGIMGAIRETPDFDKSIPIIIRRAGPRDEETFAALHKMRTEGGIHVLSPRHGHLRGRLRPHGHPPGRKTQEQPQMSILIDKNTRVLIQGITGKQGRRVARWRCSTTARTSWPASRPARAARTSTGCPSTTPWPRPWRDHPEINTSLVSVPREGTKDAALEAIAASGIRLVNILTEGLPRRDAAQIVQAAKEHQVRVIGPSSIGLINPVDRVKIGAIGGNDPGVFYPGEIAIFSKSGGMCLSIATEIFNVLGHGTSIVVGIGGDRISGTNFKDLLELVRDDERTKLVIINGEVGGDYEEEAARYIQRNQVSQARGGPHHRHRRPEHLSPRLAHGPCRGHHRRRQFRHLREQSRGLRAGRRHGGQDLRGA